MFIGHFAVGLAAKRLTPRTSLGTLFTAHNFSTSSGQSWSSWAWRRFGWTPATPRSRRSASCATRGRTACYGARLGSRFRARLPGADGLQPRSLGSRRLLLLVVAPRSRRPNRRRCRGSLGWESQVASTGRGHHAARRRAARTPSRWAPARSGGRGPHLRGLASLHTWLGPAGPVVATPQAPRYSHD